MTYSADFMLFYVYALVLFTALAFSATTLTLQAASGSIRAHLRDRAQRRQTTAAKGDRACTNSAAGTSMACIAPRGPMLRSCV